MLAVTAMWNTRLPKICEGSGLICFPSLGIPDKKTGKSMITAKCCHSENERRLRLISPTSPQNFFLVDEGNCPKKIAYSYEDGKRELKRKSTLIEKLIFQSFLSARSAPLSRHPLLPFHHDSSQYPVNSRLVTRTFGLEPVHHFNIHAQRDFSAFAAGSSATPLPSPDPPTITGRLPRMRASRQQFSLAGPVPFSVLVS